MDKINLARLGNNVEDRFSRLGLESVHGSPSACSRGSGLLLLLEFIPYCFQANSELWVLLRELYKSQ
ncbi:hypothetical protein PVK06_044565 [Gossypium arboreum]|uniref:Uncharacterized protein n=1 Tax=Gossypium arboreum TaxID=29729 RepID=A0ABR0MRN0_GOSAR|nr:hypothetical protein PVK06_044565 [Gossypium arboreum]